MLIWSDDQIAALGRTLLQGRAGQPSLLLVQGEPGAGKSSLLGELVRRAHEFQLLAAEGRESEDSPAARPVLLHTDDTTRPTQSRWRLCVCCWPGPIAPGS